MKIDSIKYRENLEIDGPSKPLSGIAAMFAEIFTPSDATLDEISVRKYFGVDRAQVRPKEQLSPDNFAVIPNVLKLTNEFEMAEDEVVDGIGLPKYILSGSGPTGFTVGWPGPFEGLSLDNIKGPTDYHYYPIECKDLMEKFKNANKLFVSSFYWHETPDGVIQNEDK